MRRAIATCAVLFLVAAPATLSASAQAIERVSGSPDQQETIAFLEALSDGSRVELPALDPTIPSPAEFLGYPLGHRFTHHEKIVQYLEHLETSSERVRTWRYGETYEGRPLELVAISSPGNLARLEQIQADLQRIALGQVPAAQLDALVAATPIAVWLAYGVHGNEASSAEAAMAAAWVFASATGEWTDLLERAVILIDPLCNPDGRERYVHSYETLRGREPDPFAAAAEHFESWPGGRQNHYLVDLNRDWAWMTQRETRDRIAVYRSWDPQVYVDFHEMSPTSTYFFPPSADPIHPLINPRSLHWLETFGRGNAAAFDQRGWVYYVGERFDLFYPGYGDSYPGLRGAIGMTYEMAGHGRAGQALERPDGSMLTLADRIARHLTTSIATARTAIDNHASLLGDFARFRRDSAAAEPSTYLWRADQQEAAAAAELLSGHGIEVGVLEADTTLEARLLRPGSALRTTFPAGTYAVSTNQPLGNLARALLELDTSMPESFIAEQRRRIEQNRPTEFFDITAWSLPLAYNLETWVVAGSAGKLAPRSTPTGVIEGAGEFGFLIAPHGLAGYRLAGALQDEGILFRMALNEFELEERRYPSGTLFVPRRGNDETVAVTLHRLALETGVRIRQIASGYSEKGISLGSDNAVTVGRSRIGLVGGSGVSPTSFGFLWHLLDQQVRVEHHRLDLANLGALELADFDVLVLPSGGYEGVEGATAAKLGQWLETGGVLIAVEEASAWLRKHELSALAAWQPPKPPEEDNAVTQLTPSNRELHTPGAALTTRIARPHPLTAGLVNAPAVLYEDRTVLLATGNPRQDVVVAVDRDPVVAGFAWPEAEERLRGSLLVGLEPKGRGAVVVFAQEPNFRLFWRATATIFLNAVLYGPSLVENGLLR